jgi:alpha-ketoglutarate-dependent taurine dioxygenase
VVHPLVLVHPETGKKALYVSEGQVNRIVGLTDDEGRGLLQFLFKHAVTLEFTYRHTYSVDDLVFWDNRACQHIALADYVQDPNTPRLMHRLTVLGKESGRFYDANAV